MKNEKIEEIVEEIVEDIGFPHSDNDNTTCNFLYDESGVYYGKGKSKPCSCGAVEKKKQSHDEYAEKLTNLYEQGKKDNQLETFHYLDKQARKQLLDEIMEEIEKQITISKNLSIQGDYEDGVRLSLKVIENFIKRKYNK